MSKIPYTPVTEAELEIYKGDGVMRYWLRQFMAYRKALLLKGSYYVWNYIVQGFYGAYVAAKIPPIKNPFEISNEKCGLGGFCVHPSMTFHNIAEFRQILIKHHLSMSVLNKANIKEKLTAHNCSNLTGSIERLEGRLADIIFHKHYEINGVTRVIPGLFEKSAGLEYVEQPWVEKYPPQYMAEHYLRPDIDPKFLADCYRYEAYTFEDICIAKGDCEDLANPPKYEICNCKNEIEQLKKEIRTIKEQVGNSYKKYPYYKPWSKSVSKTLISAFYHNLNIFFNFNEKSNHMSSFHPRFYDNEFIIKEIYDKEQEYERVSKNVTATGMCRCHNASLETNHTRPVYNKRFKIGSFEFGGILDSFNDVANFRKAYLSKYISHTNINNDIINNLRQRYFR